VNSLRAGYGLPSFQDNGLLDQVCQNQSDYMASIGTYSDTDGQGRGSMARLLAAGYPAVRASENVYWGPNTTAQDAINFWMGDAIHQIALLDPDLHDIGAGVTVVGDAVYFCQIAALTASEAGSRPSTVPKLPGTAAAAVPVIAPFVKSTPNPDGSIVHVIQPGDTLLRIATGYGIQLIELERLNTVTATTTIFPGRKLIVRMADTPTATPAAVTPTRQPSPTVWLAGASGTATAPTSGAGGPRMSAIKAGGAVAIIALIALAVAGAITAAGYKNRQ
jgi:LysM repeat protein